MKFPKHILYFLLVINITTVSSQCLPAKQKSDANLESYINNHFIEENIKTFQLNPVFDSVVTSLYSKVNSLKIVFSKVREEPDWDEYYVFKCQNLKIEDVFDLIISFYENLKNIKFTDKEKHFIQKESYPDGSSFYTEYIFKRGPEFINLRINSIGPSSDDIIIKRGKQNEIILKIEFRGT
jgi:hypothetical protein